MLCVDDEETCLDLLEEILVLNGYKAVTVTNGKDALLQIRSQTIDLVLLDINMPGMDGLEVCRQIKEDPKLRDIQIIMITGLASHEDRVRGIEAGVEDYFTKPFNRTELLARIKILLKVKKLNDERRRAEEALKKSHDELDDQVKLRTAELTKANEMLQADITQRKQTEEALRASEAKYRNIFENAMEGIYQSTPEGRFITINAAFARMAGYDSPDEIIAAVEDIRTQLYVHPEDRGRFSEIMSTRGIVDGFEVEFYKKDGNTFWVIVYSRAVKDDQGKILYYEGIVKDITLRKQVEELLHHTLDSLRKAFHAVVQVLVSAVETRDPYTSGHQLRSADLARAIATEMGLPQDRIEGLRMAGSIHDIGKLAVPAEILSKPTKLTDIEFSLIKEHARQGYEMLKDVESPWPLAEIVYQHHERMDGSGYPRNLKGEDILIEARILAVADVVESMASHRPYRPALGLNAALAEIENNRGTLYDNNVADACLRLFREKGFQLEGSRI
ncbi:MAG: response regulator [Syntrophales bacterium]|nr:response regulator [Syntrophales bacterium]